jgi:hypothetical protein
VHRGPARRALTDIQISTEYVVYAVRQMRDHYHSKVDILGHSQGALEGRWAIKFWPDGRCCIGGSLRAGRLG